MKTIELSLSPKYVSGWGVEEAVREILQNAIDQKADGAEASVSYDRETLSILTDGARLKTSTLLLGESGKDDERYIGKYGEGYKLALLVLTRERKPVKVVTDAETWTPEFRLSETFGEESLQSSYKNLGNLINDARLAGLVDWHAIEDRTRNLRRRPHWEEPQEIIDAIAHQYHIDYWEGQENYVEVWVEKDALIGIVEQISDKLDVACFSCRGYTSQSELWGAAMRLKRRCDAGRHAVLLHLGDHDPSGKDMSRDIVARLELFGADDVEFRRLALNLDQIEEFGPPPNPTKLSDSRAQGYIEQFGYECWELDALDPSVISRLIDENVRMYRDEELYRDVLMRENEEKGTLRDLRDGYQGLIQNWSEICENYDIYQ